MNTETRHPQPEYMLAALAQAQVSLDSGNLPIGAVIVHDCKIIAIGRNSIDSPANDTRHAELVAIQSLAPFLADHKRECTIYTTLEPCMMCLGAIINVGINSIVIGASDSHVGAINLLQFGEYYREKSKSLRITSGYMAEDCQALLDQYVRFTGLRNHLSKSAA